MSTIYQTIERELTDYIDRDVELPSGEKYSQYALVNRIAMFANKQYTYGNEDSQGNYKFWFDGQTSAIDNFKKNIDFDTSNVFLHSDAREDYYPVFLANTQLKNWLRDTGQAIEINSAIEEFCGWGNVVWKKQKDGYKRVELQNFFVLNQSAETLEDSPVIERHVLTQSEMRAKSGVWKNVEEAIEENGIKEVAPTAESGATEERSAPYYEVYERNGEISEAALFEAQGKNGGKENKYYLAKIIVIGVNAPNSTGKGGPKVLYAEDLGNKKMSDIYEEAHLGEYKGKWWREGIYEKTFDPQTRLNEIGNQLARGLEWASKSIFFTDDEQVVQNLHTDLMNGDLLKAKEIRQVEMRMQGFDQLANEWNRMLDLIANITHTFEVSLGKDMPSGTPFRLGALLNQNVNKYYEFIREKVSVPFGSMLTKWVMPKLLSELNAKEVLKITSDGGYLEAWYGMLVERWYLQNLPAFGPHDANMAVAIKQQKLEELLTKKEAEVQVKGKIFKNLKSRMVIVISGENVNLAAEAESLSTFINLELDPVRRQALVELALSRSLRNVNVAALPKSPPEALAQTSATPEEQAV